MTYAAITGWGKCMPPAVLSNADLASFVETTDEWITQRTGIRERRVSHVSGLTLSHVAASRALACAGVRASDVDLIIYGSCSNDEQIPNTASGLSRRLGAGNAAAMDVNTACTSFLYGLSTATAMIRTGVVNTAVVVGVEVISPFLDWRNRNVAVLFGDGAAAVVLQATQEQEGVLAEKLGCYADARDILRVRGTGLMYALHGDVTFGDTAWDFDGQEIFKRAVGGMAEASAEALARCGKTAADIDLVIPHQANLRIIEFVAKSAGMPMDRVFVTVHKLRQHVRGDRSGGAGRSAGRRPGAAGKFVVDAGIRRRSHVLFARDPLGRADHADRTIRCRVAAVRPSGGRHSARPHAAPRSRRAFGEGSLGTGGGSARVKARQVVTSLRCACTLIRMPSPMKSDTSAVPP